MKYFVYLVIAVVVIAVVAGFFVVGSPREERLRKLDDRRAGDIQSIQGYVVNFWQAKGRLPNNLSELEDDIQGVRIPADPETDLAYGYEVRGPETFALCATFALPSETLEPPRLSYPQYDIFAPHGEIWTHGQGYECFERTIDKDIYKPRSPSDSYNQGSYQGFYVPPPVPLDQ